MKKFQNRIIITGPGRSGTTYLSSLFDKHPDVYGVNKYLSLKPLFILSAFFHRINVLLPKKLKPTGAEAYKFWNYYLGEFSDNSCIKKAKINRLHKVFKRIEFYSGRKVFVTKITGESRKHIFDQLFGKEKYCIVNIERHPVKVVASMCKQRWMYKHRLNEFYSLTTEDRTRKYIAFYKNSFNSRHILYQNYPYFLTIRLEDLIISPLNVFAEIYNFTGLHLQLPKDSSNKRNKGNSYLKGEEELLDYQLLYKSLKGEIAYLGYTDS